MTLLRHTENGLAGRPVFYAHYNDVVLIVEDENKENFYNEIIRKLFEADSIKIHALGVGGKRRVLERFRESIQDDFPHAEFYLIDGDFDDLLGKRLPAHYSLYQLERYDIESYLVEEVAICNIVQEELPRLSMSECQTLLGFMSWRDTILDATTRLAAFLAALQEIGKSSEGFQSIERYILRGTILPSRDKIEQAIQQYVMSHPSLSKAVMDSLIENIQDKIGGSVEEQLRWVSGKYIWVPLVIKFLHSVSRHNFEKESLCFRLAKCCDFHNLSSLRSKVLDFVKCV